MSSAFPLARLIIPPRERSNTLGAGGNHGVRGENHLSHAAFIDYVIAFALFIAVRSLHVANLSLSEWTV